MPGARPHHTTNMSTLALKVPPPIAAAILAAAMWLISSATVALAMPTTVRICWCRVQPCWRHCLSASENDCESKETRECVIPRRIRRLSHHPKPDVCRPPAHAGRMVRPLVRTVGNRWTSRILSIYWQVPDRAGRTSHVAEVWHGLLGLQGTSPQVAVRPSKQRLAV